MIQEMLSWNAQQQKRQAVYYATYIHTYLFYIFIHYNISLYFLGFVIR